ncbi:SAM-dependent methyltransferase [Streptodolium elevatio]
MTPEDRDDAAAWRLPRGDEIETYAPPGIDTSTPHTARMYDYFLGGKTNFAADRAAGDRIIGIMPGIVETSLANRAFLGRAVRHVARAGVRQFLDIGTGIPTSGNTHEVAQAVLPEARVAYVDNDPIVLAHARALMSSDGRGRTSFSQGDLREPEKILASPEVRDVIDFDSPVCLNLLAIMHFIGPEDDPERIIAVLREAMVPGSYMLMTHGTGDFVDDDLGDAAVEVYKNASAGVTGRTHAEIAAFFEGFDLVEPGIVRLPLWRPDGDGPTDEELRLILHYGGVGRLR